MSVEKKNEDVRLENIGKFNEIIKREVNEVEVFLQRSVKREE